VTSGVKSFKRRIMGLSEFYDTLVLVSLHFGSDIGGGSLCGVDFSIAYIAASFSW
jgi:hypothetical protein